jgi:5S rRNA maturation endonuclease (ribonuclease M5)
MDYDKTLEDLEKILTELREENKKIPIIVEGEKDIEALRKLDIKGEIISFNKGMSIPDFCDMISKKYRSVILLTDWDRKGGFLCTTIKKNLESLVTCNTSYRKNFAQRASIKTIEGLPSWIETLKRKVRLDYKT